FGAQAPNVWVVKLLPLAMAANHWPVLASRPTTSPLPSPLRSATCTSRKVPRLVGHEPQSAVVKLVPLDTPTHQWPVAGSMPTRSVLPSPLKSPVCTNCQLLFGLQ